MTIPGWEEWYSNNFCQAGRLENYEGIAFESFYFTLKGDLSLSNFLHHIDYHAKFLLCMVVLNTSDNTVYSAINKHLSIPNSSNPALSKAVFKEDFCGLKAPCSLPREAASSLRHYPLPETLSIHLVWESIRSARQSSV